MKVTEKGRKVEMTPAWVASVKPEAGPVDWRDAGKGSARGLVLRVEASGLRTWVLRYTFAGRDRRFKIGASPAVSLKAARTAALRMAALAANGTDPQLERERLRVGTGVAASVAAWLDDAKRGPAARWKGGLKGGSARSFLPHVRRFVRDLGSKRLAELTAKDVERFISGPEAAATRNRALTALRAFYWWAGKTGLTEHDPTAALAKEREDVERSRVLTDDELRALIHGFDAMRYGRAVRLLALTGLRRDEVLGARWSWLDAEAGTLTIPPAAEKAGRARGEARRVALSAQAVALLAEQKAALFAEGLFDREGFVFATSTGERPHADALKPGLNVLRGRRSNGQKASTDKRAKRRAVALAPDEAGVLACVHDVRRTVAHRLLTTCGARSEDVNHVVMGHVRPKLLRTYMPVLPLDEARAALTRWADDFARIVGDAPRAIADAQ